MTDNIWKPRRTPEGKIHLSMALAIAGADEAESDELGMVVHKNFTYPEFIQHNKHILDDRTIPEIVEYIAETGFVFVKQHLTQYLTDRGDK